MKLLQIKWEGIKQTQIPVIGKTFDQAARELEERFHNDPKVAIIEHFKNEGTKAVAIRSSTRSILDMYKLVP